MKPLVPWPTWDGETPFSQRSSPGPHRPHPLPCPSLCGWDMQGGQLATRSGVSPAGLPLTVQPLKSLQDPGVCSADADGLWLGLATTPHAGSTQTPDVCGKRAAPSRQACGALEFTHLQGRAGVLRRHRAQRGWWPPGGQLLALRGLRGALTPSCVGAHGFCPGATQGGCCAMGTSPNGGIQAAPRDGPGQAGPTWHSLCGLALTPCAAAGEAPL